jgi:hypothetical protein
MRVARSESGDLEVGEASPLVIDTLAHLPEWIQSDDPRVREALLPEVYEDPDDEAQWRRYVAPELEHLFLSRAEIVRKDLGELRRDGPFSFAFRIPAKHAKAWIAALQAGRVVLYHLHRLSAADLEFDLENLEDDAKALVLLRMEVLGALQHLMLEAGT